MKGISKFCSKCKRKRNIYLFSKDKQKKDGLTSSCLKCHSKRYFAKKKEIDKKHKIYNLTPRGIEVRKKSINKYHKSAKGKIVRKRSRKLFALKYKYKVKAWNKIRYEKAKGNIIAKEICENCNSKDLIGGHHPDYSKPLEVIWLCPQCHKDTHMQMRAIFKP